MAARTQVKAGNWSDFTVWNGGTAFADGDSATLSFNTVFDVDQAAYTTGVAGIVINTGISLTLTSTPGTYYLKMDGSHNISGAGSLLAGTSSSPVPTTTTFTIDLNAQASTQSQITITGTMSMWCTQPTNPFALLSAAYTPTGATVSVDRNLTGDAAWSVVSASGATEVCISNAKPGVDSQWLFISALTSTQITFTGNITTSKNIGTYAILMTRNVRVINAATYGLNVVGAVNTNLGNFEIRESASRTNVALVTTANLTTLGGVVHTGGTANNTYLLFLNGGCSISSIVCGGNNALNYHTGTGTCVFSGMVFACTEGAVGSNIGMLYFTPSSLISGCTYGLYNSYNIEFAGTIQYCTNGIYLTECNLRGAVLQNNTTDIQTFGGLSTVIGDGASLNSSVQVASNYNQAASVIGYGGVYMYDIGGVAGAFKSWQGGGIIASTTSKIPTTGLSNNFSQSYNGQFTQSSFPVFFDVPQLCQAGQKYTFYVWIIKDTNSMTATPQIQVIDPNQAVLSAGAILSSATMADTIWSSGNWQLLSVSYTATAQKQIVFRVIGQNGSGNMWFNYLLPVGRARSQN